MKQERVFNFESGQVLIFAITFLAVILVLATALISFVGQSVVATRRALAEEQALQLSEAGIDKAVWELNNTAGSYTGETGTVLGTGVFDVTVTSLSSSRREILATGYVPDSSNPRMIKQIKVEVSIDTTSVAFNFGVQVGDGGLDMGNNAIIDGNVFSNGSIDGGNGATITGSAFSAGFGGLITDQIIVGEDAQAHTINNNVSVGGNARGHTIVDSTVSGNAFANTLQNCTVGGDAFYTTVSSCTISGSSNTGFPGEPDLDPAEFPISDEQIDGWKTSAAAGGTIVGDYILDNGATASLGRKKITGTLVVSNLAELTITGPIWVEGSVTFSNNSVVKLDPSYEDGSEVIVSDNTFSIDNTAIFQKAGPDSYIVNISTFPGDSVFSIGNNSDSLVVFAPNGEVVVSNNAGVREVTAWKVRLDNNAVITYELGLANLDFTSGPGAAWAIDRGTWREVD